MSTIAFVTDERLSRERGALLTRIINSLRGIGQIELLGSGITEEELIQKLETQSYQLVLAPWYRYLAWSKVEAFYGLTRTSGPTFAGYFCEPLLPYELGEHADHLRTILLDFSAISTREAITLVKSLMKDSRRSGIRPLLDPATNVYCESWYSNQGLGLRMDAILGLPEITGTEWARRANAIRVVLTALWSLIYDVGPGKSELNQTVAAGSPRAYFQVGCDPHALVMRLCYAMPGWTPKDALAAFWPDPKQSTHAARLLQHFADLVRVHVVAGTQDLEVVVSLLASAPSEREMSHVHTLWIEPIAANLVAEVPFEAPNPNSPHLKTLPGATLAELKPRAVGTGDDEPATKAKDRFLFEAAMKIRTLKDQLAEKEDLIRELKSGGIGTAPPVPPPDAETLLEAFQERYFESRFQIRQFEIQIAEIEARPRATAIANSKEAQALRLRMNNLIKREQLWIKKLATTIEMIREERKKTAQGAG